MLKTCRNQLVPERHASTEEVRQGEGSEVTDVYRTQRYSSVQNGPCVEICCIETIDKYVGKCRRPILDNNRFSKYFDKYSSVGGQVWEREAWDWLMDCSRNIGVNSDQPDSSGSSSTWFGFGEEWNAHKDLDGFLVGMASIDMADQDINMTLDNLILEEVERVKVVLGEMMDTCIINTYIVITNLMIY